MALQGLDGCDGCTLARLLYALTQPLTALCVHDTSTVMLTLPCLPLQLHPAQETGEAGGVLGPAPSVEDLQAYLMAMHQEADDFLQLVRNGDGTVQSRLLMLANPGGAFMQSTPRCAGRSRD